MLLAFFNVFWGVGGFCYFVGVFFFFLVVVLLGCWCFVLFIVIFFSITRQTAYKFLSNINSMSFIK